MAIVINGSGTVTGPAVGGLPDGTVDADTVAADVATQAELDAATVGGATGVDFNDNVKARFGGDNDLSIYHDHANSQNVQLSTSVPITFAANDLKFANGLNDTLLMIIKNDGTVGFGVTPTSFYSGYTGVQVGGNGTLYGQTAAGGSNNFWIGQNVRAGTDGSEKAITTGNASQMLLTGGGAEFKVTTASANADANVTWSTALHLLQYDQTLDMYRGVQIKTDALRSAIGLFRQTTSNSAHIEFRNTNGLIGSIKTNGTSTSFNTSSDYRLKENVDYTWDATTRLKQLKPARFNFISDEDNTLVDGFLAHEVSSVVPEAISGTKDATETLSNAIVMPNGISVASGITEEEWTTGKEDGTYPADTTWKASHTQDVHQSIDQSKLVPLLVKTIQELEARITALEA